MDECDVVTGLRGALVERADDSSNGVLCGIIDELKCDVVLTGGICDEITQENLYIGDDPLQVGEKRQGCQSQT